MKPSYRPEDLYPWMKPSASRDRSAVASYLHDRDTPVTVAEVTLAVAIEEAQTKIYLLELVEVGAVEFHEGLFEWMGTC